MNGELSAIQDKQQEFMMEEAQKWSKILIARLAKFWEYGNSLNKVFQETIIRNRIFLLYAMGVIFVAYGFELANLTISMDDNGWIYRGLELRQQGNYWFTIWISQERWGMALIEYWLINNSVPVAPLFFSLSISVVAFCMIFRSYFQNGDQFWILPIFIACPIWYFAYSFTNLTPGVGIGLFFAACGAVLTRISWKFIPLAAFFLACAIGTYQAFLLGCGVICLFFMLEAALFRKDFLFWVWVREGFCYFVFISMGYFFHRCIVRYFIIKYNVVVSPLLDSYTNLSHVKSYAAFQTWLPKFFQTVCAYLEGGFQMYGSDLCIQPILIGFSLLIIIGYVFCQKKISWWMKPVCLLLLTILLIAPFLIFAISSAILVIPPRTLLAVPLVFAMVIFLGLHVAKNWIKVALVLLILGCCLQYFYATNRLAYMNFHAFSRDVILAERIISRVESLPNFAEVKDTAKIPLMIIGAPVQEHKCGTPFYQINTVGMSLVGYNIRSHVFLMRIMGINNYFPAPPEIYRKLAPACMLFPNFPASGSIQIIDGVAVVKFSDFTPGQIRENNLKLKTSSQ